MRIEIANRQRTAECPKRAIRSLLRRALQEEGSDGELSVAVVGDEEMRDLSKRFLGREGTTDVLAFPYGAEEGSVTGEIVVNAELAAGRAAEGGHDAAAELMLYIVHGLLHLLGYDDHAPAARRRMRKRERDILGPAGYDVP